MTAATSVKLLAESYYSKLWIGKGTAPTTFTDPVATDADGDPLVITPQLGWCYVDVSSDGKGTFYIYDGTTWQSTESKWTGAFL